MSKQATTRRSFAKQSEVGQGLTEHKERKNKMPQRVPLMFVPPKLTRRLSRLFTYVSNKLSRFIPGMKYDLEATDIGLDAEEYISSAIVNGLVFFLLFSALLTFLYQTQGKTFSAALGQGAAYAALIFAVIFFTLIRYPKIMAGKKAELVDKHLIFALKDLLLQISSGVTLFNGMVNVSKAGYGQASIELDKVVRNVNSGMPVDKALEKMALESKSEFLRKTTWQLINTLKPFGKNQENKKLFLSLNWNTIFCCNFCLRTMHNIQPC